MTYRISNNDYEIWDNSSDGDLMYNIFNICKICKGKLKQYPERYSSKYNDYGVPEEVPIPICIECLRDEKIEKLKI